MRTRAPTPLALLVAGLLLVGCSGVDSLTATSPKLSAAERDTVRVQVDKAMEQQRFNVAWNQEVQAGAERDRLETIAIEALRARSGHAGDMFAALRERHGALSEASRRLVGVQVEDARRAGRWLRAVQIEILTADDPPAFTRAWAVYRDAPPDQAPALLASITDAKDEHAESDD